MKKYLWSDGRDENGVDASEFDVDFEAEVGQGLGRRLVDVLGLDALRGHAQDRVAHALDLGVHRRLAGQNHHN